LIQEGECWKISRGNTKKITEPTYKGMTPSSTQNLKALGLWVFFHLGLWVFFLICCSTFSFLSNVGLRLTLEYLTISPSSVSPSSTLIHEITIRKTFRYRVKLLGESEGENTGESIQGNDTTSNPKP